MLSRIAPVATQALRQTTRAHALSQLVVVRGAANGRKRVMPAHLLRQLRAIATPGREAGREASPSKLRSKLSPQHLWRQLRALASAPTESVDVPQVPARGQRRPPVKAPETLRERKVGFIGWGAMAQAVSLGIIRADLTDPERIMVTDVVPSVLEAATKEGIKTATSNRALIEWADVVVVAVKPQMVDTVVADIAPHWTSDKILVSICAGITIESYQTGLGEDTKVVRVMPNTPCLIAEAATAYTGSSQCSEGELDLVHGMFGAVGGAIHRVPEYLLNTVTGLSGSGPAYVYMLIQALSDAGVHGGLPRNVALSLAAQTVAGAAKMVQESGQHPMVLKEAVTSPAGTTIAGVRELERSGFTSSVMSAVETARARSEALSGTQDFLSKKKVEEERRAQHVKSSSRRSAVDVDVEQDRPLELDKDALPHIRRTAMHAA